MFTEEEFKKIFFDINFIEIAPIKKSISRGYYISHGKIKGKEVVVKILTKNDKKRVRNYKKELVVSKILQQGRPKEILSRFACTWEIGENEKFIWNIREYVSGEVISLYNPSKILMGYDEIDSKFKKDKDLIISGIRQNLNFLWSIDVPANKNLFRERFSQEIDQKKIKSIESGIGCSLKKQIDFYKKHKDKIYSSKNIKASFGDLIPANIIYNNKKVVFLDFEWFTFDNYIADISLLWLYLWRYPTWQEKLIDELINSVDEKSFFKLNIIRSIIGYYSNYVFVEKSEFKKAPNSFLDKQKFFSKHIWTRYLAVAGESYETVIKTK